jgi:hypothetical protein
VSPSSLRALGYIHAIRRQREDDGFRFIVTLGSADNGRHEVEVGPAELSSYAALRRNLLTRFGAGLHLPDIGNGRGKTKWEELCCYLMEAGEK